ncbi:hypothetical protein VHEMI06266 [[Torrubiella] hemipterigena]|uniref:Pre-mRNA splicing factor CLF1 n=1 Tax=[Torrubiella] hemipterigena TaxID=1531966 RepID=A0A0A1T6Q0_9HYPO|nr:hypothetical protein VHEMI06266 [[Torrubiella] hemipterigena]
MSAKPPASLDKACSAIFGQDNAAVLYSYSHDTFLSLPLKEGGNWQTIDDAGRVKVNGGVCVGTEDSFWVIGGNAPDRPDYPGLQKYDYNSKKWSIITVDKTPFKNWTGHGAAYVRDGTKSIVLYGGGVDGKASTSTWIFSTQGHTARAFGTENKAIPPAKYPVIGSWGPADVAMIATNGAVYAINPTTAEQSPTNAWRDLGIKMAAPVIAESPMRAAIVAGDDNSRSLLQFDLSQSPNKFSRVVLQDATGKPVRLATEVPVPSATKAPTKRGLTLATWPTYDGVAPDAARSNPAMAQSLDGSMIVFSGGNSEKPIAMFNAADGGWVNTTSFFSDGRQKILDTTSTASLPLSTSTSLSSTTFSTAVSSTTAPSIPTGNATSEQPEISGLSSNAILGITLGTIAGFLVLLGLLLLLLRRYKQRRLRVADDTINPEEKDTVAFAKHMQPSASPAHYRGHNPQLSAESYSSVAIMMGRMGPSKPGNSKKRDSFRSSISSLHKQFKSTISKPIPQATTNPMFDGADDKGVAFAPSVVEPKPRNLVRNGPVGSSDGTRRSSGWNKYWSGGSALQILGYGNKRTTATSEQSSRYSEALSNTNSQVPTQRATQDSATVPPLSFDERPGMNRVVSGSPIVSQFHGKVPFAEGMSGTIERPISPVSTASGYSSGIPESVNEVWNPTDSAKPWGANRAPSSSYTHSGQFGTALAPANGDASAVNSNATKVTKQVPLAMAGASSDMSWLNLGDQSRT